MLRKRVLPKKFEKYRQWAPPPPSFQPSKNAPNHNITYSCVYTGTEQMCTKFSTHTAEQMYTVQGRGAREGYLRRRITVILSSFNLRTWFFAQIAENRQERLPKTFLGPGDNFSKSYDETQIWSERARAKRPRGIWCGSAAIQICFRHNFSK
jgi:hypothetical protein